MCAQKKLEGIIDQTLRADPRRTFRVKYQKTNQHANHQVKGLKQDTTV
jgi:hypothetical protein